MPIDLRNWPKAIAQIDRPKASDGVAARGKLFLFVHDKGGKLIAAIGDGAIVRASTTVLAAAWADPDLGALVEKAATLWRTIFEPNGVDSYQSLLNWMTPEQHLRLKSGDFSNAAVVNHAAAARAIEGVHVKSFLRSLRLANAYARSKGRHDVPRLAQADDARTIDAARTPFEPKQLRRDWIEHYKVFLGPSGETGAFDNLELVAGKTPKLQVATADADSLEPDTAAAVAQFFSAWAPRSAGRQTIAGGGLASFAPGKYGAIRSHPTIMKYLKMIIDVEMAADVLEDGLGLLSAAVLEKRPTFAEAQAIATPLPKTAYQLRDGAAPSYFETASSVEFGASGAPSTSVVREGILHCPPDRFVLESMNVLAAMHSMQSRANAVIGASHKGASERSIDPSLPEIRNAGIAFMDTKRREALTDYAAFRSNLPDKSWLFVEDLVIGYSVDVKRADRTNYRSLTHRTIDYKLARKAGSPVSGPIYPEFADRDEAYVVPSIERLEEAERYRLSDIVFTWSCDPLGLPAAATDREDLTAYRTKIDAHRFLPVSWDIGIDDHSAPVLRDNYGYRFGIRPRLINGRSISNQDATARYKVGDGSLGKDGSYFPFLSEETIPAPDLIIPSGEPVLDRATAANAGESAYVIVLRAEYGPDQRRRVLMPPRTSFEGLERAGAFDRIDDDVPDGAFPEVNLGPKGEYPKAYRAGAKDPVGLLYSLQLPFFDRDNPFYPHPNALRLMAAFVRDGATPISYSDTPPVLEFRKSGEDHRGARAIVLEVNRWEDALRGGRFDFDRTKTKLTAGLGPEVGVLSVFLAPAEEIELHLWSQTDAVTLFRSKRFGRAAIEHLAIPVVKGAPTPAAADSFSLDEVRAIKPWQINSAALKGRTKQVLSLIERHLDLAVSTLPIEGVNPVLKVTLVHAVERPRRSPSLHPIGYSRSLNGGAQGALQRNEGDTGAHLVGHIHFDAASTNKLLLTVYWRDLDDSRCVNLGPDKAWRETPLSDQQEFTFNHIPRSKDINGVDTPNNRFDLGTDDNGRTRTEVCALRDTRARRVATRIVATSRYMHYYQQPEPVQPAGRAATSKPTDARFLSEDRSEVEARALLDHPEWMSDGPSFWLLSTLPPPPPIIDGDIVHRRRPKEVLREGKPGDGNGRIIIEWRVVLRCYLSAKTWHASGEDELLAIICTPGNLVDDWPEGIASEPAGQMLLPGEHRRSDTLARTDLSHFDVLDPDQVTTDDDRKLSKYIANAVTRWAMDASTYSPVTQSLIPPSAFSGYVAKRANLILPPPAVIPLASAAAGPPRVPGVSAGPGGEPRPSKRPADRISIIAYRPRLSLNDGRRYVDIGFDGGASQDPYLNVGFARYQPHSLEGLELSQPVPKRVGNVPSPRTVDIVVKNGLITVEVRGAAYTQREPAIVPRDCGGELRLEDFDRPICEISLRRRTSGTKGGSLVYRPDGSPEEVEIYPISDGPMHLWRHQLPLPAEGDDLYITIRELALYPVATVSAARAGETTKVPGFFAVTVDL